MRKLLPVVAAILSIVALSACTHMGGSTADTSTSSSSSSTSSSSM